MADIGDRHTYFVTSKAAEYLCVEKLHVCTWLFENGYESVEVGLHLKFVDHGAIGKELHRSAYGGFNKLPLELWASWIKQNGGNEPYDLYAQVSNQDNARFIFNDDCRKAENCSKWDPGRGRELTFASGTCFCVLPVVPKLKDGRIELTIQFPDDYRFDKDAYIRFCSQVPEKTLSYHQDLITKKTYAYNINVNQMRNAPRIRDFKCVERCPIRSVYAIHIVPSTYSPIFVDSNVFKGIRFVEEGKYRSYIQDVACLNQKIEPDGLYVSFNKNAKEVEDAPDPDWAFSMFSIFERDYIGRKQNFNSFKWAFVGAVLGALIGFAVNLGFNKFAGNQAIEGVNRVAEKLDVMMERIQNESPSADKTIICY